MIESAPLWNDAQCDRLLDTVKQLRPYWIDRSFQFYTLGAASYQDNPAEYPAKANYTNQLLVPYFYSTPEFVQLETVLSKVLGGKVITQPGFAVPGFHIFDKRCNGKEGSFHIDLPFRQLVNIPGGSTEPMTFTVLLEAPKCGAGLNYWSPDVIDPHVDTRSTDIPPEVVMYERGRLYYHTGLFYHQIANPCDVGDDEYRITFQGHSLKLADGSVLIYF